MRVVHISPSYFSDASLIGGGERYVSDLALWMSKKVPTTFVTFSSKRASYFDNGLKIEIYPVKFFIQNNKINPLNFRYLRNILRADIVHVHCVNALVSDLSCLFGSFLGKRVFVTDYGGGSGRVLNRILPVLKRYDGAIAYSEFGIEQSSEILKKKTSLIKGGIDIHKFSLDSSVPKQNKILFVGRILPHKGINYLIEAYRLLNRSDYKLTILGKVYSEKYYQSIQKLAKGLCVEFVHDADDDRLLDEYRTAKVTILPSVHTDCYGNYTSVPELMGFALLESQACGTPVICTNAGALPEFVDNGLTGIVVKQNSSEELAVALRHIINVSESQYIKYQIRCREWVQPLSWSTVVQRHLDIYENFL